MGMQHEGMAGRRGKRGGGGYLQKGGSPWEVRKTCPRCSTLPGIKVTTGCSSAHSIRHFRLSVKKPLC